MTDVASSKLKWFRASPDRLLLLLLATEGLLWLSDRLHWPAWHKGYAVLATLAVVGAAILLLLLGLLASLIFRWRFQFRLRSLLVLTLAVALACSWLKVEIESARQQREIVAELHEWNGFVFYDYEYNGPAVNPPIAPPRPAWLRRVVGDDFFASTACIVFFLAEPTDKFSVHLEDLPCVASGTGERNARPVEKGFTLLDFIQSAQSLCIVDTQVADELLERIAKLDCVQELHLGGAPVTDAGMTHLESLAQLERFSVGSTRLTDASLRHLARLRHLRALNLTSINVTDAGLPLLVELDQLQSLDLSGTRITNAGLAHLVRLRRLERLSLNRTLVTDAGLKHLERLSELEELELIGTQVTEAGVKHTERALPNCIIYH
jgi:hypothetical protein